MQSYRVRVCHGLFPADVQTEWVGIKAANAEQAMIMARAVTGANYAIEAYRRDDLPSILREQAA